MTSRVYSIQSQLSLVFLGAVIIMITGGILFSHYANRLLSATQFFTETTLPRIETANELWQTALEIKSNSKRLVRENSQEELERNYQQLGVFLDRLENLTALISQKESESDILSLNWTSQTIRSHVQLVAQMEAQRLNLSDKVKTLRNEIRLALISIPMLSIPMLSISERDQLAIIIQHHEKLHRNALQLGIIVNQLDKVQTMKDFNELRTTFDNNKSQLHEFLRLNADYLRNSSNPEAIRQLLSNLDMLFSLQQQYKLTEDNINKFISELNNSVEDMTQFTSAHVNSVFANFHQQAKKVIRQGQQILFLAISLMIGLLILYFTLYWRIVIRSFGTRISQISKAMATEPNDSKCNILPVDGRDEIADMARAAEILLNKAMRLNDLATMDELTRVYNRRRFFEFAQQEAARAARKKTVTTIAMIDIDHFKSLNDTHGHVFGDKVLREMSQACNQSIRMLDLFARYGGEEFVLLMPETTLHEGQVVAERMRKRIESMHFSTENGLDVQITVSIGLAASYPDGGSIDQTVKNADNALYMAKKNGRNRVELSVN